MCQLPHQAFEHAAFYVKHALSKPFKSDTPLNFLQNLAKESHCNGHVSLFGLTRSLDTFPMCRELLIFHITQEKPYFSQPSLQLGHRDVGLVDPGSTPHTHLHLALNKKLVTCDPGTVWSAVTAATASCQRPQQWGVSWQCPLPSISGAGHGLPWPCPVRQPLCLY